LFGTRFMINLTDKPAVMQVFLLSFLAIELIGLLVFPLLRRQMQPNGAFSWFSVAKGSLERLVLLLGLFLGHDAVLILFGALKIGTRISQQENERISNDYFLLGNLLSVLLVLLGVGVLRCLT
jgi:hypothetical protein